MILNRGPRFRSKTQHSTAFCRETAGRGGPSGHKLQVQEKFADRSILWRYKCSKMSRNIAVLPKSLIVFAICIPLALLVGYLLATPTEFMSFGAIGIVLLALCTPLLLRWHYAALIFCWNANLTIFFLPGQPSL